MIRTIFTAGVLVVVMAGVAMAELQKKNIEYKDGDQVFEGYYVYDDAFKGARPGILVIHDWMGLGPQSNARTRCEMLAKSGYAAFACDMYGKGVRPTNATEAAVEAGKFYKDRSLFRSRAGFGLTWLKAQSEVNPNKVAAIGYCYGGAAVLELARSGADILGVVTFHGGLSNASPDDARNIKAKLLILHGADDPFVKPEEVAGFEKEMTDAKVDWQLVKYAGAVHSFTNPAAGDDPAKGAAYNERADKRSWVAMKDFFEEIFR